MEVKKFGPSLQGQTRSWTLKTLIIIFVKERNIKLGWKSKSKDGTRILHFYVRDVATQCRDFVDNSSIFRHRFRHLESMNKLINLLTLRDCWNTMYTIKYFQKVIINNNNNNSYNNNFNNNNK